MENNGKEGYAWQAGEAEERNRTEIKNGIMSPDFPPLLCHPRADGDPVLGKMVLCPRFKCVAY